MTLGKKSNEIAKILKGYEAISDEAGYAVFVHNAKGKIFEVNEKAERITGYSKRELLNMNVQDLHAPAEFEISAKKLRLIARKREVRFESQFRRKDGRILDVKIIANKFKFKKTVFIIGIVKDITASLRKKSSSKPDQRRFAADLMHLGGERMESVLLLTKVAEARDHYTIKHSIKVTNYAALLAEHMGLKKQEIQIIRLASMVHDIGKIGIDQRILMKPSYLTKEEYDEVKEHPVLSVEILKHISSAKAILPIIKYHHENFDGTGYPEGLKGRSIPLGARILAVADIYDALTTKRAYRNAYSHNRALEIMKHESGRKLDPELLSVFIDCIKLERKNYKNRI